MIKIAISTILLLSYLTANDLNIEIFNMKNYKGQLLIALFNKGDSFPKPKVVYRKAILKKIDNKIMHYTFKNLPKGDYALTVVHDTNSNGKMDTYFFGMPKEGYGLSNNKKSKFSPPTFKESKFYFDKTQTMKIKIHYII